MGVTSYIVNPVDFEPFTEAIRQLASTGWSSTPRRASELTNARVARSRHQGKGCHGDSTWDLMPRTLAECARTSSPVGQ